MPRTRFLLAGALLFGLLVAPGARAASVPPGLRFRSLIGARVTVHFHQGLESLARQAAALATAQLEHLEARYGTRVGRVEIVLSDTSDSPNGFTTPFPYPLVWIRAAAPDGTSGLGNHDGWLRLVLAHELAHAVHLEPARGALAFGRKLFGRAPFLFPNALTPTWLIEGLATYEETEATAFGRGRDPDARMVLRMAALERRFPQVDEPMAGLDRWPGGEAAYFFGESFARYLSERQGTEALPRLARDRSGRLVPYLDGLSARAVTGRPLQSLWEEWSAEATRGFEAEAARVSAAGLTRTHPLTTRGVRQHGPRFSPDGAWLAYTSVTLDRYGALRVMRPDGSDDRRLVDRSGGGGLAWTPDGRALVFDEPEVHELFSTFSDLRLVEVAGGRVRRLTRGLRASDPDVAPQGGRVVFVRRLGDRSDLFTIAMDGSGLRRLTESAAGTEWSGPRFSPQGECIAAARLGPGGFLDLVLVDPATGRTDGLTEDRARDVEPAWLPDGSGLVFRSDRDGISNLYLLRLADRALFRVTNLLGGAFTPDVAGDGRSVALAAYSARGYDIHRLELDARGLAEAMPFADPYPPSPAAPPEPALAERPYRSLAALAPRFWSPWFESDSEETRIGAATAANDPLLRQAWAAEAHYGTLTHRAGYQAAWRVDRLRPTLLVGARDGWEALASGRERIQEATLRVTLPLRRSLHAVQDAALGFRRRRETLEAGTGRARLDLGALEAAWGLGSAKQYPFSISPVDGWRLRVSAVKEDPAFGSDVSLVKASADARGYLRVPAGLGVVALRGAGGTTWGSPGFRRSFAVGGFPDGSLLDLVATNQALLRGYPDDAFSGRSFLSAGLEWRLPLAHPQRGWRTAPLFLRHLHAALFFDSGHAWSDEFRARDVATAAGAALGADVMLGHALPFTVTAGVARGFSQKGKTRAYVRAGLSF